MKIPLAKRTEQNVGYNERVASVLSGSAMLIYAVLKPSRWSMLLGLGGGYLLYRGGTGTCYVYKALGIDQVENGAKAGIHVERSVSINRPRAEVFSYWRNLENLPAFMQTLKEVRVIDANRSHWVAQAPLDQTVEWDAEIQDEREGEMIAWRSLPGSEVDNQGVVWFKDAPGGRGTEVHVSLHYEPPGGVFSAAFAALFGEAPNQTVLEDLRHLKEVLEAGEIPTVFGQTSGRADQTEQEREEIKRRKGNDAVDEASRESFPASDAPAWTGSSIA